MHAEGGAREGDAGRRRHGVDMTPNGNAGGGGAGPQTRRPVARRADAAVRPAAHMSRAEYISSAGRPRGASCSGFWICRCTLLTNCNSFHAAPGIGRAGISRITRIAIGGLGARSTEVGTAPVRPVCALRWPPLRSASRTLIPQSHTAASPIYSAGAARSAVSRSQSLIRAKCTRMPP